MVGGDEGEKRVEDEVVWELSWLVKVVVDYKLMLFWILGGGVFFCSG